ncbi:hypothetical protein BC827DRAFT_1171935 [Russula dissimulans]|nr:hypothetical protein BC827DRAFT_1171935 [Russula dissimulans]
MEDAARYGATFVHHQRITHEGLLTAVVESWYPHSNDSHGVILEDDVEVSSLFYAWLKLALRHRYGDMRIKLPPLFDISLYQQKILELHIEGRKPFDARWLFNTTGIGPPNTQYLSQKPCGWGAVYFPEHWREFHTYVAYRLTDPSLSLKEDIVPNVRSSRWQRSWKKYCIGMVFLRYTMLYQNYASFSSLSTNHLEPSAQVKRQPRAVLVQSRSCRFPMRCEHV